MAKKIIRSDEKNPFWIGCEWTGVFTSAITIIIIIALTLMFKQGAEEALQLRILLQIRRVGFILSVNIFLIFMIYFSKFGQLRMEGKALSLNLKHFLGSMLFSAEWGLLFFGVFQSLFIIFLVRQW
jgi:choline/glycine/proline betaine transport protein